MSVSKRYTIEDDSTMTLGDVEVRTGSKYKQWCDKKITNDHDTLEIVRSISDNSPLIQLNKQMTEDLIKVLITLVEDMQ